MIGPGAFQKSRLVFLHSFSGLNLQLVRNDEDFGYVAVLYVPDFEPISPQYVDTHMKFRDQLLITGLDKQSTKWNQGISPNKPLGRPGQGDPWLTLPTWVSTLRVPPVAGVPAPFETVTCLTHSRLLYLGTWDLENRHLLRVDQIDGLDLDRHRSCVPCKCTHHIGEMKSNVEFLFTVSHGKNSPDCAAPLN